MVFPLFGGLHGGSMGVSLFPKSVFLGFHFSRFSSNTTKIGELSFPLTWNPPEKRNLSIEHCLPGPLSQVLCWQEGTLQKRTFTFLRTRGRPPHFIPRRRGAAGRLPGAISRRGLGAGPSAGEGASGRTLVTPNRFLLVLCNRS